MDSPAYPCRELPTRHCPDVYEGVCGQRPCARYESDDAGPWLPELLASMSSPEDGEWALRMWASISRDDVVRAAVRLGVRKHRVHVITGIARTTIDRILAGGGEDIEVDVDAAARRADAAAVAGDDGDENGGGGGR